MEDDQVMDRSAPEYIIATLYNPNGGAAENALELITELGTVPHQNLFDTATLDNLVKQHQIYPYLCALLTSCSVDSQLVSKRRVLCFFHAVAYLKLGANGSYGDCIEKLSSNAHLLGPKYAEIVIKKIIENISPTDERTLQCHVALLELLPKFVSLLCDSSKQQAVDGLIRTTWHPSCVVALAATLCELCETEQQCNSALDAISARVRWNIRLLSVDARTSTHRFSAEHSVIDPDDLPNLFYQLILMGKKCESNSNVNYLRRVVVVISHAIDKLLLPLMGFELTAVELDEGDIAVAVGGINTDALRQRYRRSDSCRRIIEDIFSNIVHHLSLAFVRDSTVTNEIIFALKNRWLFSTGFSRSTNDNSARDRTDMVLLSPGKLLLCCIASQSPYHKDKIITGIAEFINEVYSIQNQELLTLWYQDRVWRSAMKIQCEQVWEVFGLLTHGPVRSEVSLSTFLSLSFLLIDNAKLVDNVLVTYSRCIVDLMTANASHGRAAWSFGAWLLIRLFIENLHIRAQVIKELCLRMCTVYRNESHASSTHYSAATDGVTAPVVICVHILSELTRYCPVGLLDSGVELFELFTSLPNLSHDVAAQLIGALCPMFSLSAPLGERCSIALRKISFSKDLFCRKAAACSLLQLLKYQLIQESSAAGTHASTASLKVEEILILLRRFMQHQPSVRAVFYDSVCSFGSLFVAFRPYGTRLLRSQLASYFQSGADNLRLQLNPSQCLSGQKIGEPLMQLMLAIVALVSPKCTPRVEGSSFEVTSDAFILSQLPMSQNFSQMDSFVCENVVNEQDALEVKIISKNTWKIIKGACDTPLAHYGLNVESADQEQEEIAAQFCKCDVVFQFLHGCLACLFQIPPPSREVEDLGRADKNFMNLIQKINHITDIMTKLVTKLKIHDEAAKKAKKKQKKGESEPMMGDEEAEAAAEELDGDAADHRPEKRLQPGVAILKSNWDALSWHASSICKEHLAGFGSTVHASQRVGISGLPTWIPNELYLVARGFEIFHEAVHCEADYGASSEETAVALGSHKFLHCYLLRYCTHILDSIWMSIRNWDVQTELDHLLMVYPPNITTDMPRDEERPKLIRHSQGRAEQLSKLLQELFCELLKDLMIAVKNLVDDSDDTAAQASKKRGRNVTTPQSSNRPRLILTNLSHCLKCFIQLERNRAFSTGNVDLPSSKSAQEAVYRQVVAMTSIAFSTMSSSSVQADSITTYVKQFCSLMMSLQESPEDGVENASALAWKLECPTMLQIVTDLVDVMENSEREKTVAKIYQLCEKKIADPTPTFSVALINFFVLSAPNDPASRFEYVGRIADLCEKCCESQRRTEEQRAARDDNDFVQDDLAEASDLECFTLLNKKCLPGATCLLVSILEKVRATECEPSKAL
jgi:hypothetical protein